MKYIIIDDENQLYKRMYADLFSTSAYDVEEIPRVILNRAEKILFRIHTSSKLNTRFQLPLKNIWHRFYGLSNYEFNENENYCVIILNGALWKGFTKKYLHTFKKKHPNVKLILIFHDSMNVICYRRSVEERLKFFDRIYSFDESDCSKYGFHHFYQIFSMPSNIRKEDQYKTDIFFCGMGRKRVSILHTIYLKLKAICEPKFLIAGCSENNQLVNSGIEYNKPISYEDELRYAYNTGCMLEVVSDGQTGITLRTVEAISFNKKLITNNSKIKEMPFYDERYIKVIENVDNFDWSFVKEEIEVKYHNRNYFSPIGIIKDLELEYGRT